MFEIVLFDEGLEQAVVAMLRSRFYSSKEISNFFRQIAKDDPDSGLDAATVDQEVREIVDRAERELAKESKRWPKKTDNDRLIEAFEALNRSGIRAIENYGFEASDCVELYREIRGKSKWRGYCFYHNQDLIRAVLGGELAIRFSAAVDQPTDVDDRNIGEAVVEGLRSCGLKPVWNGDPRQVIELPIEWQRRA